MNEIVRHIEYLLVSNDCVVIPGLGAVLAHTVAARYDEERGCMMPPSRTFTFNAGLSQNDGMLISSVARSKSVTYEVARHIVATEVDDMLRTLSQTGTLSLGKAGRLNAGRDGSMSFVPSTASCLSPEYMGLPELHLQPVIDIVRQRNAADSLRQRRSFGYYASMTARVAASLVALIALGFVLTTPITVDNAQYASLGIESFKADNSADRKDESALMRRPGESTAALVLVVDRHSDASEEADTASHNAYIRSRLKDKLSAEVKKSESVEQACDEIRFDNDDKYCLVIASLASEAEAEEFVEKSEYTQLGILSKDGRYRVYAATGSTISQAQSAAKALSQRFPDAWVCRK